MTDFKEVARLDEVPPGSGASFTVADKDVAVFNVDATIYAIDDACLHKGSSLAAGQLEGKVVTCRSHGWRCDMTTGGTMSSPGYGVASYAAANPRTIPISIIASEILDFCTTANVAFGSRPVGRCVGCANSNSLAGSYPLQVRRPSLTREFGTLEDRRIGFRCEPPGSRRSGTALARKTSIML